jgi:hypothetical protein
MSSNLNWVIFLFFFLFLNYIVLVIHTNTSTVVISSESLRRACYGNIPCYLEDNLDGRNQQWLRAVAFSMSILLTNLNIQIVFLGSML